MKTKVLIALALLACVLVYILALEYLVTSKIGTAICTAALTLAMYWLLRSGKQKRKLNYNEKAHDE